MSAFDDAIDALFDPPDPETRDAAKAVWKAILRDYVSGIARESGTPSDGDAWIYDSGSGTWKHQSPGGTPDPHAASHQNGGGDEINVAGLSGLLATAQTPASHTFDPATGPHTGTAPEGTIVFNGTGHAHAGASDGKQIDHGSTTGKADDDHPQYVLADGTRDMQKINVTDGSNFLFRILSSMMYWNSTSNSAGKGAMYTKTFQITRTSATWGGDITLVSLDADGDLGVGMIFASANQTGDVSIVHGRVQARALWRGGAGGSGSVQIENHSEYNGMSGEPGGNSEKVRLIRSGDTIVLQARGDGTNEYKAQGFAMCYSGDVS